MIRNIFLLALSVPCIVALFPEHYILQVTPHCGDNLDGSPSIAIISDLRIKARAECANGVFYFANQNDDNVNYELQLDFPGGSGAHCRFIKRANAHVYVVKVLVSYGEVGQMVSQDDEEITVTCTYDSLAFDETESQNVVVPLVAAKEIQYHKGREAVNSTLSLQLTDVLGRDITGQDIDLGRKVQLKAESDGGSDEVGLRPIACNAIGENSGKKYAILRGGCGDGIIFDKSLGFTITGLVATSAYFATFHLENDVDFSFECNFTLCNTNCDGSSCTSERRRRDTSLMFALKGSEDASTPNILLESEQIHVISPRPQPLHRRKRIV